MHVGAFVPFWLELTISCGRTWAPAFTIIRTQTVLLPYCGFGDVPSVI